MAETYIELGVSEQKNAQTLSRNKMQYEDSATTMYSIRIGEGFCSWAGERLVDSSGLGQFLFFFFSFFFLSFSYVYICATPWIMTDRK